MREYSVPARFSVGEHDSIAAMVFEHERDDPDFVIYQRQIDGDGPTSRAPRRRSRFVLRHWV